MGFNECMLFVKHNVHHKFLSKKQISHLKNCFQEKKIPNFIMIYKYMHAGSSNDIAEAMD